MTKALIDIPNLKNSSSMTPIERSMGRFMRAPDGHDGDGGSASGDGDGGDSGSGDGDDSALGGADGDKKPADGGGDKSGDGDKKPDADGDKKGDDDKKDDDKKPEVLAPEKYELKASEGKELDPELIEAVSPALKELNLTNDQAQTLIPFAESIAEKAVTAQQDATVEAAKTQAKTWLTEAKEKTENWDEAMTLSGKALDAMGHPVGSDFRNLLNATGFGNHPVLIEAFSTLGKIVGEDSKFLIGGKGAPDTKGNVAHKLYPDDAPK